MLLSFPAHAGATARVNVDIASTAAAVKRFGKRGGGRRPLLDSGAHAQREAAGSDPRPDWHGRYRTGQSELASASFASVPDTTQPPFTAVGRVFLKVGNYAAFCSGTAINSASRRLVLTAGHCLYSILPGHRIPSSARYFDFVPDYSDRPGSVRRVHRPQRLPAAALAAQH